MTYPRSHLLAPDGGGVYHVHSRCVRRAWLCGTDSATGRNFSHRRAWIERRILKLSEVFAVAIYGYAVMSNHYHIVLQLEPSRVLTWSDEEVAQRWFELCPGPAKLRESRQHQRVRQRALCEDTQRLQAIRQRLCSLSWFMRFINEPLARIANREDECTGRFWEGRFKSQLLLDEAAVLAAMVYVDLNPVRAGMADEVASSEFTSLQRRLRSPSSDPKVEAINPGAGPPPFGELNLRTYLGLVHWTAQCQESFRRGVTTSPPEVLNRFEVDDRHWFSLLLPTPGVWRRAVGSPTRLKALAASIGQAWICVPRRKRIF